MKKIRGFKKKHEKHLVFQRSLRLFSNNSFHKSIVFAVAALFVLSIGSAIGITFQNTETLPRDIEWSVTLNFTETGGKNDYIIFGEAPDASDGVDIYDGPNPPGGPGVIIDAYFTTDFPWPHNILLQEIKEYPDTEKEWNFTVWWTGSDTTVTISWDTDEVDDSEYDTVMLCNDSGTPLVNMLTSNNYGFFYPGGSMVQFTIICSTNQPPVAVDDAASTLENTPAIIDVLANDYDPDGDNITISDFDATTTQGGTVADNGDGNLIYTPPIGFTSPPDDTFNYEISDDNNETDNATVYITVIATNLPPTSSDNTVTTQEDTTYIFILDDFVFNDSNPGDQLEYVKITQLESDGSLQLNGVDVTLNQEISRADISAEKLTFTPNPDEHGNPYANFKFKVSDGDLYSLLSYTMTIDVTPVNDDPTANNDTATVDEDSSNNQIGVLDNDFDIDGDDLEVIGVTKPSHGTAAYDEDYVYYTPTSNYCGSDSFMYTITDNNGSAGVVATVYVTVTCENDDPTANDDTAFVEQYSSDNQIDVLSNDFDVDGDDLEIIGVTMPSHGTATYDKDFVYYTPEDDYFGSDSFTYMITDNNGSAGVTATVDVTVVENEPPEKPEKPSGETRGKVGEEYTYTTSTTDSNNDQIYYYFSWGDDTTSGWVGPYESGELGEASHTWNKRGNYEIKVKSKDEHGLESEWSDILPVSMPKDKAFFNSVLLEILQRLMERFPLLEQILSSRPILGLLLER